MPSEFVTAPLAGRTVAPPRSDLVLTEVLDPGGTDPPTYIAPLHIHTRDDEAWYVLEGELAFLVDGSEVRVPAGGGIVVPAGTEHTFWNPVTGRTRYLLVMTATVHRLVEALHEPGPTGRPRCAVPRARQRPDRLALSRASYRGALSQERPA